MSKPIVALLSMSLAACTTTSGTPTPLAQLTGLPLAIATENHAADPTTGVVTPPTVDVAIGGGPYAVDQPTGACPTLGEDVTATFDGVALSTLHAGGWNQAVDGTYDCVGIELALDQVAAHPGSDSVLELSDASAHWRIAGHDLVTADFALVQAPTRGGQAAVLAWPSATAIDQFYVEMLGQGGGPEQTSDPVLAGNTVSFTISQYATPAATLVFNAARTATPTACDGPVSCTLQIAAGANFSLTLR